MVDRPIVFVLHSMTRQLNKSACARTTRKRAARIGDTSCWDRTATSRVKQRTSRGKWSHLYHEAMV